MPIDVADFDGVRRSLDFNPNGRNNPAGSKPVVLSTEDYAAIQNIATAIAELLTGTQPVSAAALPLPTGAATSALQTAGNTAIATLNTSVGNLRGTEYEAVAASQANQVLGATGAVGDLLECITITPLSTSPGEVTIRDGAAGAVITLFEGGPDSVSTLHPFPVYIGARALAAGWRVSTGEDVSVFATGNFT